MVANSDLISMYDAADAMTVIQDNPWAMADVMQETLRVAGSEIAHGPVPAGATADQMGRLGRKLRRSGSNLNAAVASKNASATMRIGGTVNQALAIAMKTGRTNMQRLIRRTAGHAYQVAMTNDSIANDEQLKREMEERAAMRRRMMMLGGVSSGGIDEMVPGQLKTVGGALKQRIDKGLGHMLGHTLAKSAFGDAEPNAGFSFTGTMDKVTSPVRGMIDRVMGREPTTPTMGMNAPSFEMSLPEPDAPAPTAPVLGAPRM